MVAKKKQRVDGRLPDAEDQGHASHGQSPNCQQTTADGSTDPAFDRWLRTKLETLYGSVVDEPIPDEMLKIIADFQKQKKMKISEWRRVRKGDSRGSSSGFVTVR